MLQVLLVTGGSTKNIYMDLEGFSFQDTTEILHLGQRCHTLSSTLSQVLYPEPGGRVVACPPPCGPLELASCQAGGSSLPGATTPTWRRGGRWGVSSCSPLLQVFRYLHHQEAWERVRGFQGCY